MDEAIWIQISTDICALKNEQSSSAEGPGTIQRLSMAITRHVHQLFLKLYGNI